MSWNDFKALIIAEYCPINEEQKLEEEFWNHAMVSGNNQEYNDRFHELTCLLPKMFETEEKLIQKYIKGIPQELKKIVLSSECTTLKKTINLTNKLVDEAVSDGTLTRKGSVNTVKPNPQTTSVSEPSQFQSRKRNRDGKQKQTVRSYGTTVQGQQSYFGNAPKCTKCSYHHFGQCPRCGNCGKVGHYTKYCQQFQARSKKKQQAQEDGSCFTCGSPDHFMKNCPRNNKNKETKEPRGRAFRVGAEEAKQDPQVVTGMFLLNNHLVSVLFDSGADRSFVTPDIASKLAIPARNLDNPLIIELANGKLLKTAYVIPN